MTVTATSTTMLDKFPITDQTSHRLTSLWDIVQRYGDQGSPGSIEKSGKEKQVMQVIKSSVAMLAISEEMMTQSPVQEKFILFEEKVP